MSGPSERTRAMIGLISRSGCSWVVASTTPSARLRPYSTSTASPSSTGPSAAGTEYVNVCPPRGPAASTATSTKTGRSALLVVAAECPSLDQPVVNHVGDRVRHAHPRIDNEVVDRRSGRVGQVRVENVLVVDFRMDQPPLRLVICLTFALAVEQLLDRDRRVGVVALDLAQLPLHALFFRCPQQDGHD